MPPGGYVSTGIRAWVIGRVPRHRGQAAGRFSARIFMLREPVKSPAILPPPARAPLPPRRACGISRRAFCGSRWKAFAVADRRVDLGDHPVSFLDSRLDLCELLAQRAPAASASAPPTCDHRCARAARRGESHVRHSRRARRRARICGNPPYRRRKVSLARRRRSQRPVGAGLDKKTVMADDDHRTVEIGDRLDQRLATVDVEIGWSARRESADAARQTPRAPSTAAPSRRRRVSRPAYRPCCRESRTGPRGHVSSPPAHLAWRSATCATGLACGRNSSSWCWAK